MNFYTKKFFLDLSFKKTLLVPFQASNVFFVLRQQQYTIQALLSVGEKTSKPMLKFIGE